MERHTDGQQASEDGSGDRPRPDGRKPRAEGPRQRRPRARYGTLLIILVASYLLSAFFGTKTTALSELISDLQIALFTVAGLLALRAAPLQRRVIRLIVTLALVISALMIVVAIHFGGEAGHGTASAWAGILLLLTVMLLIRQILLQTTVTVQSIYGAISAYLIIGLMFATFYSAMYYLGGRDFFSAGQPGSTSNFQYFSFTTLTTLGYGDYTAATSAGRAVAMLEAMTGQIFLATLVAKLVAAYRPQGRGARSGDD